MVPERAKAATDFSLSHTRDGCVGYFAPHFSLDSRKTFLEARDGNGGNVAIHFFLTGIKKKMSGNQGNIPDQYTRGLSKQDKAKQVKSIRQGKERPQDVDFESKRSKYVVAFEKKYGRKITDSAFIAKNILKKKGQEKVLDKGRGAYFSSGSRPKQTAESWALARLASVIMNGPARRVDQSIWDEFKV